MTLCDQGGRILNFVTSHFCCFNLIISRCKIAICDVTLRGGGGLINVTTCDKDGEGVKNHEIRVT